MSLLQMSFLGAVFILAVVILRAVAINRLPKKTFLVLWGIVCLRLLIPLSVPSAFSIYSLIMQKAAVFTGLPTHNAVLAIPQEHFDMIQENQPSSADPSISVWFLVWGMGMILCAVLFALLYLRFWLEFRTSLPVHNRFVEQWLKGHQSARPISIRQSDKISAPLTYGLFRPVILMPKKTDWNNQVQLHYILLHEYLHICHHDIAIKLISIIALCIHWFNPMVWVMYLLLNRDIELVCDECVIKLSGMDKKASYALTLIGMEEQKSGFAPLCNNFSKNAIEERITAIMKTKKITGIKLMLAGVIVLGTTGIFATTAYASQTQQAAPVGQTDKIEYKSDSPSQITDAFGIFFKDGKQTDSEINNIRTAGQLQADDSGTSVEKTKMPTNDLPKGNVIYFNTEAERDEHFRALEANSTQGRNRYAGFEAMYADIDTSAPITYIVK